MKSKPRHWQFLCVWHGVELLALLMFLHPRLFSINVSFLSDRPGGKNSILRAVYAGVWEELGQLPLPFWVDERHTILLCSRWSSRSSWRGSLYWGRSSVAVHNNNKYYPVPSGAADMTGIGPCNEADISEWMYCYWMDACDMSKSPTMMCLAKRKCV